MFFSVIVPVYNAAEYLPQCLDSLLEQDIPQTDYEILCVNDGSTDSSAAILEDYASRYSNIRPIHQSNAGVAAARNKGLAGAKGTYIWFVDADDLVRPNILGRLRQAAAESQCDQLTFGGFQFREELSRQQMEQGTLPDNVPGAGAVVWRSLIRRDFLNSNSLNFRHPELTHGEDGQFMYELGLCLPQVASITDTVYFYRLRSGSAETGASPENRRRRLRSHIAVAAIMARYYTSGRTDEATANRLMEVLWGGLYDAARLPLPQARQALAELHKVGLYPCRRVSQCTLTCSYMTDRRDFIGRSFDYLYMHLHRPWGFGLMWVLCHVRSYV